MADTLTQVQKDGQLWQRLLTFDMHKKRSGRYHVVLVTTAHIIAFL